MICDYIQGSSYQIIGERILPHMVTQVSAILTECSSIWLWSATIFLFKDSAYDPGVIMVFE